MNPHSAPSAASTAPWGGWLSLLRHLTEIVPRLTGSAPIAARMRVATSGDLSRGTRSARAPQPARLRPTAAVLPSACRGHAMSRRDNRSAAPAPLRVIRVVEAGQSSALTGRILMSGRMADVCAELDRMVERESAMRALA